MTTVTMKVSFRTAKRAERPDPVPEPVPTTPKPTSSIARRIALAHHVEALIEARTVTDYAEVARLFGITRARVSQIADLALLAPDIQAAVLLGKVEPRDRHLRAVGRHALWTDQRRAFASLFPNVLEDDTHDRD